MKITSLILNFLAICLALIFLAKIVFWLKTDQPISRGSMLILALFIIFLTIRNKYTYFLMGGLAIFCIAYKYANHHISGYLIVDFMSSLRIPISSINKLFLKLPYYFYFLILVLQIVPSTVKIYFKPKSQK